MLGLGTEYEWIVLNLGWTIPVCTYYWWVFCFIKYWWKLWFIGSFHTASKHSLSIWHDIAKLVFNQTEDEDFVKHKGVYNKLVIDCAFRENLQRKKQPTDDGGCDGFEPSITTNGMCYTFNGQHSSEIWKASNMITTFSHLFPSQNNSNKLFGGSRTVQGN